MIEATNLTKYYGPRKAIDGLTFSAEKGEVLGFLGPNGAGKTTTLRILTAYMPPSEGSARVAGFDVVEQSLEVRRRIGYMPETVPLYPEMSVQEYLDYMAALRRVADAEERVDEVIERMHLEDRADSYIGRLSKGLRQRVGLAQALLNQPEVLILDEPTIGLDPGQVVEVRELIRDIGREHTVLLSTHILSEAQQLCRRVLIINQGRIVAEDSPERLQARLAGAERLTVRVAGDGGDPEAALRRVRGVTSVQPRGSGEYEIETTPGVESRPEIARALVKADLDLLELRVQGVSLEDIFLELTRSETPVEN
jgi:ABC-2 type transport system ATP-binding protein